MSVSRILPLPVFAAALLLGAAPLCAQEAAPEVLATSAEEGEAQLGSGIAAIVNDEVISTLDVESRIAFVLTTTRLTDSPEIRARLKPQIIRSLIDEILQLQEASRNGINPTPQEVDKAIAGIEAQRGMPAGALPEMLARMQVPVDTFRQQVKAQYAWSRLVLKKIRPQIKISDEEVERERAKSKNAPAGSTGDVQIELLALPVDRPENDAQVKALADKLVAEIRAGTSFESVAQQLSGASAAGAVDVKPFWVPLSQLDPIIAGGVEKMENGALSEPLRTAEGYTLVKLLDRRAAAASASGNITEVVVKDMLLRLKPDATKEDVELMLTIGREVAKHPGNCADASVAGISNLSGDDIAVAFRRETESSMPEALRDIVAKLQVGSVSEPHASMEGIRLFMLCERVEKPAELADREETTQRIYEQKIELEAQKYLRNLRRDATVDVRLRK